MGGYRGTWGPSPLRGPRSHGESFGHITSKWASPFLAETVLKEEDRSHNHSESTTPGRRAWKKGRGDMGELPRVCTFPIYGGGHRTENE